MFVEDRKEHRIIWNWSYRQLSAAVWVFGIKPRSSGTEVGALNRLAVFPVPT